MKKNKNKEDKRERAIKILKIVGSALGLTLCTAGFVALLTVGVRGCAHQSTNNDVQLVKREEKKLSVRQLNDVNNNDSYVNTKPLNDDNMPTIYNFAENSDDYSGSTTDKMVVSYGGIDYNVTNTYFYYQWEMSIEFSYMNSEGDAVLYGTIYYDDEQTLVWEDFDSEVIPYDSVMDFLGKLKLKPTIFNFNRTPGRFLSALINDYFTLESELLNTTINFNSVINPFAPWGANFDYFINTEVSGAKTLFKGLFYDTEGNYYNAIKMHYLGAQGMRFGTANSYNTYQGNGSHYMTMSYQRLNGTEVTVNAQDYAIPTGGDQAGNGVTVMLKSNHWTSSIYQNITILTAESTSDIGINFTPIARLSGLNNVYSDYSGVGENVGVMGNVFTLLKGAFSAWLPILNIQVLPGIALGVFVFLPLVVMIVLFIVWLFKR